MFDQLLAQLLAYDIAVLQFFNLTLSTPWLDQFWLFITQMHKSQWFVLGVAPVILVWSVYQFRMLALKVILMLIVTVAVADAIAYRGFKKNIDRPRPFSDPRVSNVIRKVGQAHGPSFPSNHATNAFAAAYILGWYFRRRRHSFYVLATLIALSRPALGVHYPSDIVAGALLGTFVGFFVTSVLIENIRWLQPPGYGSNPDKESWTWRIKSRRLEED